jgi:hypothetical protein
MAVTPEEAATKELTDCLKAAEDASGMKFDDGVWQKIFDLCYPPFLTNEPVFSQHAANVTRAAEFAGRFARLYAEFDRVDGLRYKDIERGVRIMRTICKEMGIPKEYAWCPGFKT